MPKFGYGDEQKNKLISLDSLTPTQQILLNQLLQKGQTTGFANPALDYEGQDLDLHRRLVTHPQATFFFTAASDALIGAGIFPQDLLIVDRALDVINGDVVIANVNTELLMRRYHQTKNKIYLLPEHPDLKPLEIGPNVQFEIWGVVSSSVRLFRNPNKLRTNNKDGRR
ncbi:MAG TPA: S24 family peptidase [Chloroflexia bacterium]|nr:S24 family peptidase [Chloroflexia bacterium]